MSRYKHIAYIIACYGTWRATQKPHLNSGWGTGSERPRAKTTKKFDRSPSLAPIFAPTTIARSPRALFTHFDFFSCPDTWRGGTNLAFTVVTTVPTVTFSRMCIGPYILRSQMGGLLFLSTTSNSTSTSALDGGSPRSEARTRSRYLSRCSSTYGGGVSILESIQSGFRHSLAWDRTIHKEVNNQSKIAQKIKLIWF
jgi:hypothetical protein